MIQHLIWLRLPGDLLFGVGAALLAVCAVWLLRSAARGAETPPQVLPPVARMMRP